MESSVIAFPRRAGRPRWTMHISESNIVDVLPGAVFRGFHQVDQVHKPGVAGQFVRQIIPGNLSNRHDFDMAIIETIRSSHFYTRRFPHAHTGGHIAALYASAEFLGEEHMWTSGILVALTAENISARAGT
jgi:hypothetical protein